MTPREFAEHVERESNRINQMLDAVIDQGSEATAAVRIDAALSELNRLARQHAIEQERKG